MTTIQLTTRTNAPIELIFDLSRNIDVHQQSTAKSNETAIDGITSGLINLNETVTWRGKHFGVYLTHKSLISAMEIPTYFQKVVPTCQWNCTNVFVVKNQKRMLC